MDFKSIIRRLIIEEDETKLTNWYNSLVKPKEGKKQGLIDFPTFKRIVLADPTTKKPEEFDDESATYEDMVSQRVQPGKYANWLLKNYVKPNADDLEQFGDTDPKSPGYKKTIEAYQERYLEDMYGTSMLLKDFAKIKQYLPVESRDINKLTPNQLKMVIDKLPQNIKDKLGIAKANEKVSQGDDSKNPRVRYEYPGSEIIHVGPKFTVIKIEGNGVAQREAARKFGGYHKYSEGESSWCTSADGGAFESYIGYGPLYVIMPNDDKGEVGSKTGYPKERYQFHFFKEQFMDRHDHQIKLVEFLNDNPDLKELFKPIWAEEMVGVEGNKVDINYPNGKESRYISLYGFETLFNKLPENIKYLLIQNTSKESFEFDVPESLGRFKNLEALMFNNFIKSLPNSIGELKNLQFLTLSDNKSLKELPESLADLPKLSFITMRNAPNVVIPPKLAERLVEEGNGFYYVQ